MPKKLKPITFESHLGAVVANYIDNKGDTRDEAASSIGVGAVTFGRHLRGHMGGITVRELVAVCHAYGGDPSEIIAAALKNFGGIEKLLAQMSPAEATTVDINTKRKQNEARAMTVEQIETADERAATTDPEMDTDESN